MSKLITKATKSMHRATLLTYFPQNGMYTVEETTPKKEREKRGMCQYWSGPTKAQLVQISKFTRTEILNGFAKK
jgi:hypothetical protein